MKNASLDSFTREVGCLLEQHYALTLNEGMHDALLVSSFENGETPAELVEYVGRKFDLPRVDLSRNNPLFWFMHDK